MNIQELLQIFFQHPAYNQLYTSLSGKQKHIHIQGSSGSQMSFFSANLFSSGLAKHLFYIVPDADEAAYIHSDLTGMIGAKHVLFFPASHKRSIQYNQPDPAQRLLRTQTLDALSNPSHSGIVITYPDALIEKVITRETLSNKKMNIHVGEQLTTEFITELLYEFNFENVDFVTEPGQFSVRGSIIDIFSYSHEYPFRIDFWDTEVESIRTFSVDDQRSIETIEQCTVVPNIQSLRQQAQFVPVFSYAHQAICIVKDAQVCIDTLYQTYTNTISKSAASEDESRANILLKKEDFEQFLTSASCVEYSQMPYFSDSYTISLSSVPQPPIKKNFSLLGDFLLDYKEQGYTNFFITQSTTQVARIRDIYAEINPAVRLEPVITSLYRGFIDHDVRISCFTDHEIFERYHKHSLQKAKVSSDSFRIEDLKHLNPGDYIVHIDHGIGSFAGIERIDVNGKKQETVKLVYRDNDMLYVSIHNLHKIAKYKAKEGIPPKIHKLGSGVWQNTKQKAKSKVKDIAKDLIALYAKRMSQKGFSFSPDTYLQQELEASFFFEDTPDQITATKKVKEAMEAPHPMDMLVCGDVGFGKTEIAIRAAYKAVTDGKQVAILVPTTILALQHYKTFDSRLREFGCTVDFVCRLRSAKQQKESIAGLMQGNTDIIIGTHRLMSKDVKFKDLGLLIIDEEQKFGVRIKEALKKLKLSVDTLTLTATPIPRTLQFSLMGARDLAIIKTPPPNRHPILTEVHTYNETLIRDAILFEVQRDGQVFIINNRIQNIYELQVLVAKLCPQVRTVVGHGQMEGDALEKVMLDFINHEYDVLIATTIIESGLDIPNANTIIINDAHHFGLSDLHQLRGRVGRSNKKAYCYLLAPPKHVLTREARQRLQAIEEFSELGSGFSIAMQDLDIRGAGNLLGAEQSGFITDIGFETYQKILNEALMELRENEYKDLYAGTEQVQNFVGKYVRDCHIETDMELLFPDTYISSTKERIKLYRELDALEHEEELTAFEEQLQDRFGALPPQTRALISVVELRKYASSLGIERIVLKKETMRCFFIANQDSVFYQSNVFTSILTYVQQHQKSCSLKEKNNILSLRFKNIVTIYDAISILKDIVLKKPQSV